MGKLVLRSDVIRNENTVLTIGTFDGVHAGHKSIIERVVSKAKQRGARSVLVTFDPHPRDILNPGADGVKLLTTLEERVQILSDLGMDEMIVIPFNRDFSLLTSEEFIRDVIYREIGVSEFVIGYDHQFGRNREGTIETLKKLSGTLGFDVDVVEAHEIQSVTVSSTLVRRKLEEDGNTVLVQNFLGRPYKLRGSVIHGDKRGRKIGYPTANLKLENPRKVIPKNGVYAVDVLIDSDPTVHRGMMNIGYRPTFTHDKDLTLEVHIIDFNGELYGKMLEIRFLKRIRDERTFNGIDEIRTQLDADRDACLLV